MALRYAPGTVAREWLDQRRSTTAAFPVAFDCGSVAEAIEQDGLTTLLIPDVGDESRHVGWNAAHLAAERNLLRELYPPGASDVDIASIITLGSWISQCQRVLLENRRLELAPEPTLPYHVPHENPAATFVIHRAYPAAGPREGGA